MSKSSTSIKAKAGLFYFVFVMYSYTTGGPFGLEDQVTTSGPGLTLLFDLLIPLLWCIPISLVAAELTTAMPVEGGFYRWSRAAFGDFWGFLAGFWNWTASFLLGSAYAVLFTDYLGFWFPSIVGWKHYVISVALIAIITWVNILGIQMVGRVATVLTIIIILPVLAMCVAAIPKLHHNPFSPLIPPHQPVFQVFGIGLALGLWLYAGYEQLSSVAEEVENPQRNYPRALALVVPLSIATYVLPTALALSALNNWQDWHTRYFADAAQLIGGPWLGFAMTVAGAVMMVSILNATVLTSTRMPFAMAEDGYMSDVLSRRHKRYGTPWIAITFSALIYALLAWKSLTQLISVYIWLRIATSILTVSSAWRLRALRPDLSRPFRIPGGKIGLLYAVGAPILMSGVALLGSDRFSLHWGPAALLLGPLAYLFLRRKEGSKANGTSSGSG